ncbi:hypothetical protein N7527_007225 [Penicillium freii]|nr:hypothetical protein N7527_007225 [Penicillium freii]
MYSGHWLKSFTFWAGPSRVIDLCEHLHGISSYCLRFPGNIGLKSHGYLLLWSPMLESKPKECITESKKEYEVERKREKERKRKRENVCVDQPIVHHIPRF